MTNDLSPHMRPERSFQGLILALQRYWADYGCVILQPYDMEVGAGTFHPATLRALGPKPWNVAFVQPSRRPKDGRYGENPNRLQHYYQFQVMLKPSPPDIQDLYLNSLAAIGIDSKLHDIRFVEDDWESPTLGAWGLGWECWCDGMEVSQFTYFQQFAGIECAPVAGELTYGLERLAMYVQGVDNVYNLNFNGRDGREKVTYGDVFLQAEKEYSRHNFEFSDTDMLFEQFKMAEAACKKYINAGWATDGKVKRHLMALPAYDQCIKASHVFNLLDARGVISVTERQSYILGVRELAKACGEAWLATQLSAVSAPKLDGEPKKEAHSAIREAAARRMQQHVEAEYNEFKKAFAVGKCHLCGDALTGFDRNKPCVHWLLRPSGFKKDDLPKIFDRYGYFQTLNYLRWVSGEEKFAANINDMPDEGDGKLFESTIRYKDLEWAFSCSRSDYQGHVTSSPASQRPHYHFQMRQNNQSFIRYNDFHVPFLEGDVHMIEAQIAGALKLAFVGQPSMAEVFREGAIEEVLENAVPADDASKGLLQTQTVLVADMGSSIDADKLQKRLAVERAKGIPMARAARSLPNVSSKTIVRPGPGVVEQAPRAGGRGAAKPAKDADDA